jgi:hypothetical protein
LQICSFLLLVSRQKIHPLLVIAGLSSGRTGRHHRNATAPVAISLRSIHAFGVTATAKAAYAVTGMFFIFPAS